MSRILLGIVCGLVFGAIDIGILLSMSFPDKRAAITAAFIARFGIGFVIGASRLPWPGWAVGLFLGVLLSILQEEGSDFRVPTSLSMRERSDAEV
jgi:hypothetical protein